LDQSNHKSDFGEQKIPANENHPDKYSFIWEMKGISLSEISTVGLMNRKDTKYMVPFSKLISLMQTVKNQYFILELEGKRMASYETVYFDSPGLDFFHDHVNGKLNRSKVRRRTYLDSNLHFLETKRKTNQNKTIKTRISIDGHPNNPDEASRELVKEQTGFDLNLLSPKLINRFTRITLINTGITERVTIDFDLGFIIYGQEELVSQDNLAIIEIKQDISSQSAFREALTEMRFKKSGISKYCLGMALTGQGKKVNRLKNKLRKIQKITNNEYVA
jgi:VTC domain